MAASPMNSCCPRLKRTRQVFKNFVVTAALEVPEFDYYLKKVNIIKTTCTSIGLFRIVPNTANILMKLFAKIVNSFWTIFAKVSAIDVGKGSLNTSAIFGLFLRADPNGYFWWTARFVMKIHSEENLIPLLRQLLTVSVTFHKKPLIKKVIYVSKINKA